MAHKRGDGAREARRERMGKRREKERREGLEESEKEAWRRGTRERVVAREEATAISELQKSPAKNGRSSHFTPVYVMLSEIISTGQSCRAVLRNCARFFYVIG
jgi:hypothetical protein